MADSTPVNGFTYPELGDPPNIELFGVKVIAEQLDLLVPGRYASVSAANAANPTPTEGQQRYVVGVGFQFYTVNSVWAPMPGTVVANYRQTAAQSIPDNTSTAINFDTEDLDLLSAHSTSVNTSRFTPAIPGWYMGYGRATYASAGSGYRGSQLMKNGTAFGLNASESIMFASGTSVIAGMPNGGTPVYLNGTTDYAQLAAYHTVGSAVNTGAGTAARQSSMIFVYMGP